ncbi:MAG: sodium:proton antiporter [Alphaproteobacteria bacterium]
MYKILFLALLFPCLSTASSFNGADLSLVWGLPFAGILLSLALLPLIVPHFWHKHYGKIIAGWTLALLAPFWSIFGYATVTTSLAHSLLSEYIPFVLMIGALFIVTGGIRLKTHWKGTPVGNAGILLAGTFISSWIGTTGASMLLIRPLLLANAWRQNKTHVFIFFIFLVSNIGGSLSPLGDPPLFLGFLQGVPFFWPLLNLWGPVSLMSLALLAIFLGFESYFYGKEENKPLEILPKSIKIEGKRNLFYLAGIIGAVLLSGSWKSDISFMVYGTELALEHILRDGSMILFSLLSLASTPKHIREENHFSWDPLMEVAKIFLGIFITVAPVLAILKAGESGALGQIVALVNQDGSPHNGIYFWLSGLFSSVLDNAPTYMVFFFMAGADATELTTHLPSTLAAISQGCIYMGALTYIGNAPNFMVKSILEHRGVKMPSFFAYMAWSFSILIPLFLILTLFL